MAEDKRTRKSSRHFNLEKPVERHFNIEKEEVLVEPDGQRPSPVGSKPIKDAGKVFDHSGATTNKAATNEVAKRGIPTGGNTNSDEGGKTKWIAAALVGLLAVGGGVYYFSQQGEDKDTITEFVESQNQDESTQENNAETDQSGQNSEEAATLDDATLADATGESTLGDNDQSDTSVSTEDDNALVSGQSDNGLAAGSGSSTGSPTSGSTPQANNPNDNALAGVDVTGRPASSAISATRPSGTVEEEAIAVVRGKYGNGEERKRNLGDRYTEIQSKVNEMYRKGLVY